MPFWDPQKYDAWYETPLGKTADRLERETVFSMAGVKTGEKALDAGCGTGTYSIELAKRGARVTALDASSEMIERARDNTEKAGASVDFIKADALKIPYLTIILTWSFRYACSAS